MVEFGQNGNDARLGIGARQLARFYARQQDGLALLCGFAEFRKSKRLTGTGQAMNGPVKRFKRLRFTVVDFIPQGPDLGRLAGKLTGIFLSKRLKPLGNAFGNFWIEVNCSSPKA